MLTFILGICIIGIIVGSIISGLFELLSYGDRTLTPSIVITDFISGALNGLVLSVVISGTWLTIIYFS